MGAGGHGVPPLGSPDGKYYSEILYGFYVVSFCFGMLGSEHSMPMFYVLMALERLQFEIVLFFYKIPSLNE